MIETPTQMSGGIAYLERPGSGRVMLFLHGIGSNATSFGPLFGLLPDSFRLLAWNAPGYLSSTPLSQDWPLAENYADALLRFLDTLEIERAILVGHSLGTLIAGAFAQANPDRIQSLVLAASANGYRVPVDGHLPGGVSARIDDLNRVGPEAFARTRAARLVYEPSQNPVMVEEVRRAMASISLTGYAQAVRMLASGDLPALMADVAVEPAFIVGRHDLITPPEQTERAAAAWQAAHGKAPRIREIDGAGHAVYLQKPGEFAAALLELAGDDT